MDRSFDHGSYYSPSGISTNNAVSIRSNNFFMRYNSAALTVVVILVYLSIPNYIGALQGIPPKYFYFGFLILLLPLLLRFKTWVKYLLTPFALWTLMLIYMNGVYFVSVSSNSSIQVVEGIGSRIQFIVLSMLLGMAFCNVSRSYFDRAFRFAAVAMPLLIVFDFMLPGMLYPSTIEGAVVGRSAGTLINPTIAGEVILITFLMACPSVQMKYRTMLLVLAGVGVFLTFSRSSIAAFLMLWIVLCLNRSLPRSASLLLIALVIAAPLIFGAIELYLSTRQEFSSSMHDLQQRLNMFSGRGLNDHSAQERSSVLHAGLNMFFQNILIGAGPGATQTWPNGLGHVGAHNQFIFLAAEYGLFGVMIWVTLAILLWTGKYFEEKAMQHSMCLLFVLMTMFTHNMFDFPYWMLTFALVSQRR